MGDCSSGSRDRRRCHLARERKPMVRYTRNLDDMVPRCSEQLIFHGLDSIPPLSRPHATDSATGKPLVHDRVVAKPIQLVVELAVLRLDLDAGSAHRVRESLKKLGGDEKFLRWRGAMPDAPPLQDPESKARSRAVLQASPGAGRRRRKARRPGPRRRKRASAPASDSRDAESTEPPS
jgi:hypothetical protein